MKNTFLKGTLQLCAILTVIGFTACSENKIDSQKQQDLKIDIDALAEYSVNAANAGAIVFNISANTPWKITSNQQWCHPSPAMSSASGLVAEISATIDDNNEGVARKATLTITADGIDAPTVITINQDYIGELNIQPITDPFAAAGGTAVFTIKSNKHWSIASSEQWLTFDKESGEGSTDMVSIRATVGPNAGAYRKAMVTITATDLTPQTFEVAQMGTRFDIDKTLIKAKYNDKTCAVTVESDVAWKVVKNDGSADWYSFSQTEFNGNQTLIINLTENADAIKTVARKSTFTVQAVDNESIRHTITLKQAYNPTTRYSFELGNGTSNTWQTIAGDGNEKLAPTITDGQLACERISFVTKDLPAKGTYSFQIAKVTEAGARPHLLAYQMDEVHWVSKEIGCFITPSSTSAATYQSVLRHAPTSTWAYTTSLDVTSASKSLTTEPERLSFTKLADGNVKVVWSLGNEELAKINADNSTTAVTYGSTLTFKLGNSVAWTGSTYYSWWEYTMPEEDINWGE